jgi:NAD+ kinase
VSPPRVIVISKRSNYQRFVEDHPDPHIRSLLDKDDPSVARWKQSDESHKKTLERVEAQFRRLGARTWLLYGPHVRFDTSDAALVVTVGGDGTLLTASHHVADVPIIGVNSSPKTSVGFFCAVRPSNLQRMLSAALHGELPSVRLARMRVDVNGQCQSHRVLNEALFCHAIPAATSHYVISHGRTREEQRSSGVWIGPAAGSTGALRSAGGKVLPFSSRRLQLVTREPCACNPPPRHPQIIIDDGDELRITSRMDRASLFLDGPFQHVRIGLGDEIAFRTSDEPLTVLGLGTRRARVEVRQLGGPRRRVASGKARKR